MKLDVHVSTVDDLLAEAIARTDDPRPALRKMATSLRDRERLVFATGNSGQWAPLQAATLGRKQGDRVLVDTGGLLRSFTDRGDRYAVEEVTRDSLTLASRNPVAHLHRDGARGMPVRDPFPPITAGERAGLAADLLAFLTRGSQ